MRKKGGTNNCNFDFALKVLIFIKIEKIRFTQKVYWSLHGLKDTMVQEVSKSLKYFASSCLYFSYKLCNLFRMFPFVF